MPARSPDSGSSSKPQDAAADRTNTAATAPDAATDTTEGTDAPLSDQLRHVITLWSRSQRRLVVLAAEFADSTEWVIAGAPTAAHWLAEAADVETCTAREWIRVGRMLARLPVTADAFADGRLSYAKVRSLTRVATPANETELVSLAEKVPASGLNRALAAWVTKNSDPEELAGHQRRQRSLRWRTEPDGVVTFTARLEPLVAARLIALVSAIVMRKWPATAEGEENASADARPTLAQQRADALNILLSDGIGAVETEVIVHVRGDGTSLDDGTPLPETVVERIAPMAFLRALIHDAAGRPINVTRRQRHPSVRQKRFVKERDRSCIDCGRQDLLEYDHNPPYRQTRHTVVEELELRCAPCHRRRHDEP